MEITELQKKADWVRRETLKIHALAPETRVASSLSCVEILTCFYYGKRHRELRPGFPISKDIGAILLIPPIWNQVPFFYPD